MCIIDAAFAPYVFVLGDFNADINYDSVFGSELIEYCVTNSLCCIGKLLPDSITFYSATHGTTSWLDHY